jgi:hypothetical protein
MTILSIGYPIFSEIPSTIAVISPHSTWQILLPLANLPVTVPSSFQVRKTRAYMGTPQSLHLPVIKPAGSKGFIPACR